MRKVTYGAAVSLDGYIAGPEEAMDWLRWSDDASKVNAAGWSGVDTVLMGRKTYEFAARSGGGQGPSAVKTYVFSRTMAGSPALGELVREDAAGFVKRLKSSAGGDIMVMGAASLAPASSPAAWPIGWRSTSTRSCWAAGRRCSGRWTAASSSIW